MKKTLLIIFYIVFLLGAVSTSVIFLYTDLQREELRVQTPIVAVGIDWVDKVFLDRGYSGGSDTYETIRLYSPYHVLQWTVPVWASVDITIRHSNQWVLAKLSPRVARTGSWSKELSLAKQTLVEWVHEVRVETTFEEITTSHVYRIEVTYDRIQVGDTILYLDPQFTPTWYDDDFLWQTTSLDGKARNFLTYGCDQDSPQPKILMESYHQRQTTDACLSFNIPDEYLLFFEYQTRYEGEYLYTINSPSWVVRDIFPLFIHYDGIVVMNLPFRDAATERMLSLAWRGSHQRSSMRIRSWNANDIKPLYDVYVDQGRSLQVETSREKLAIDLYTQRDDLKSPVFPGSYYTYWLKWIGSQRRKVNAWALTSSSPKKYWLPLEDSYDATFGLDVTLDETQMSVYDGFQETTFDLFSMGNTIQTTTREFLMDAPSVCDDAAIDIVRGSENSKARQYYSWGRLMLVGKWWHANDLRISHNSSTKQFVPDQLDQWNLWHDLQGSEFLTNGTNIYMIRAYDTWGNELCSKRIAVRY